MFDITNKVFILRTNIRYYKQNKHAQYYEQYVWYYEQNIRYHIQNVRYYEQNVRYYEQNFRYYEQNVLITNKSSISWIKCSILQTNRYYK